MRESDFSTRASDASHAAGGTIKHKGEEVLHGAKADIASTNMRDPNLPMSERVSEGLVAGKERVQEFVSGGQKEFNKETLKSATGTRGACTKASQAGHTVCDASCAATGAVKHKAEELSHGAKADIAGANMRDPNLPVTERIGEAVTMGKERVQELFSGGQKEVDKSKLKSTTGTN